MKAQLSSERYMIDAHYGKNGKFVNILRNSDAEVPLQVSTQDYFIAAIKPYMHELTIKIRPLSDPGAKLQTIGDSEYHATIEFIEREAELSGESIVRIEGLIVPPSSEVIITYGVLKSLM